MTRAKRYANHAGGRKYAKDTNEELPKSSTHKDAQEKLESSEIFREVWTRCRGHAGYLRRKGIYLKEQKMYLKDAGAFEEAHSKEEVHEERGSPVGKARGKTTRSRTTLKEPATEST